MKIYIAGKVTGLPYEQVHSKFAAAKKVMEHSGIEVVNPLEVVANMRHRGRRDVLATETPWEICMRWCIAELVTCHGIVMLPCWAHSRGACLERYLAGSLGIPIYEGTDDPKLRASIAQLIPEKVE